MPASAGLFRQVTEDEEEQLDAEIAEAEEELDITKRMVESAGGSAACDTIAAAAGGALW